MLSLNQQKAIRFYIEQLNKIENIELKTKLLNNFNTCKWEDIKGVSNRVLNIKCSVCNREIYSLPVEQTKYIPYWEDEEAWKDYPVYLSCNETIVRDIIK